MRIRSGGGRLSRLIGGMVIVIFSQLIKENAMRTLKEMVASGKKVRLVFYRGGELHYATECGFLFPVPICEVGTATFLAEDKAILFLRYIRRQLELVERAKTEQAAGLATAALI
jgi:hypothetical protein